MSGHKRDWKEKMRSDKKKNILICIAFLFSVFPVFQAAEATDWEVLVSNSPAPGYLKFDWMNDDIFCLWDNYGIKQYKTNPQGFRGNVIFKYLGNGLWIADGSRVAGVRKYYLFNEEMVLVDSIPLSTEYEFDYHEVELLSNGHYLVLYSEKVPVDMSMVIDGGDPDAIISNSVIVETDRTGNVYWEWKSLDYLEVTDATPDIDLTQPNIDFAHINSIAETADGNLLVSFRHLDEIIKIDKTSGAIIWRLGGKYSKNNQFTFENDLIDGFTGFSHQHSVSILSNGNLLLYDNGNLRNNKFSRAVEYVIDEEERKVTKIWEYRHSPDIFVASQGSVCRLSNGNTLINWGLDRITEVKPDKTKAFEMVYTNTDPKRSGIVYRATRLVTRMDAVSKDIAATGSYGFNNMGNTTGINLLLDYLEGNGTITIEKHAYLPPNPELNDKIYTGFLPYRWVITGEGIDSMRGYLNLNTETINLPAEGGKIRFYRREKESKGDFNYIETVFNRQTGELTAKISGVGEIIACINDLAKPIIKCPADGTENAGCEGIICWDSVKAAEGYRLQIAEDSLFAAVCFDTSVIGEVNTNYRGLEYSQNYYIRARSFNSGDTSEWSAVAAVKTSLPPAASLLLPPSNKIGTHLADTLSWNIINGIVSYKLQISPLQDFSVLLKDTILEANYYVLNGINYNTKYYWRAKATKGEISGDWSEVRSFTTTLPAPALIYPSDDSTGMPLSGMLYWGKVAGSASYSLELSMSLDFKPIIISKKNLPDKEFRYDGLLPFTNYYWRARACRAYDTSKWSETFRFRTLAVPPALISPAEDAQKQQLQITFEWEGLPTAIYYSVQISADNKFSGLFLDTTGIVQNKVIIGGLSSSRQYFWRVAAKYGDTTLVWSEPRKFITVDKTLPGVPQLLTPVNSSVKHLEGVLQWRGTNSYERFRVQMSTDTKFESKLTDTLVIAKDSYNYHSLQYDKIYFWKVRSEIDGDSSGWSEIRMFRTVKEKAKLLAPNDELTQAPVKGRFEWEAQEGASGYNFQLSDDPGFNDIIADTLLGAVNFMDYNGLAESSFYFWRVRYIVEGKSGNWSDIFCFVTESSNPLPTPILAQPDNGSTGIPVWGSLTWKPVKGAGSYWVAISSDVNFEDITASFKDITECHINYSGLEFNKNYFWRVTAFNLSNTSRWSEIRSFLTELRQPVNITPVDGAEKEPAAGSIMWQSIDGAEYYRVQISQSADLQPVILDTVVLSENVFNYKLDYSSKYYWRIQAGSINNTSRWSIPSSFVTLHHSSGVFSREQSFIIFPNPADDFLEIKNYDSIHTSYYTIITLEGDIVLSGNLESNKINIRHLTSGCYFIQINGKCIAFVKL